MDITGGPHIAYFDYSPEDLKYAYLNGNQWEIQTVDSDGNVGSEPTLILDSSDMPHISYVDRTDFDSPRVKYAYLISTSIEDDQNTSLCSFQGIQPNPAHGNVFVGFATGRSSTVEFKVFDISGRLVREITRSGYSQGAHSTSIGCFSPGVYFCRMNVGDFTATQHFVVID